MLKPNENGILSMNDHHGLKNIFTRFCLNVRFLITLIALTLVPTRSKANGQLFFEKNTTIDTLDVSILDTVPKPVLPIYGIGSINQFLPEEQVITDSMINFSNYKFGGDLLNSVPGIFIFDLGSFGQSLGVTSMGLDARSIGFLSDGISLNDPLTGIFNLNLYPTEHIERIEVVRGTRAFLYGLNSTGSVFNLISKSKKAIRPYSKIRYSESAYDYGTFDGMFSQDVVRGMNMMIGIQHPTYGGRFPNSEYDAWSVRVKLRYNVSDDVNVFATELYNQTQLGLNGGIDPSTPPSLRFEPLRATLRNTDAYEKVTRHDIQVGGALKLFPDSTSITKLTLFHSTNLREYRDEENRISANKLFVTQDHWSQWYGIYLSQQLNSESYRLEVSTDVQSRGVIASPTINQHIETATNFRGALDILLSDQIHSSHYARFDRYMNNSPLSYGSDLTITPMAWLTIFGGYSTSYRFPTLQEIYWRDSIVNGGNFSPERHHLFEAGVRMGDGGSSFLELILFNRTIIDYIGILQTNQQYPFPTLRFDQQPKHTLRGLSTRASLRFGDFFSEGRVQYLESPDNTVPSVFPKWSADVGVYYWAKLFTNHLNLKLGVQSKLLSSYIGAEFNPQASMYLPNSSSVPNSVGTLDLIILAHIGSAYIHFIWDNILDRQYFITPGYPMTDRALRFGLSWEFLD
ncbi:MAG TPA: TonB-dependent receptor [Bacteroidota bacterium]|nr:TonB-dependent receptor [Bacteroidota bacterium]